MSRFGAVLTAAVKKAVALAPDRFMPGGNPDPLVDRPGSLGRAVSRVDGPLKVRGEAKFAAEFPVEGMRYAALLYSTIPKGRVVSFDTAAAEAAPGVSLIMTHRNAPKIEAMPFFGEKGKAAAGDNLPIFQDDRVHWNGQPIALVLADTQEQANHAKSLLHVHYEEESAVTSFEEARANGTQVAEFMGELLQHEVKDAEEALLAAPFHVDHTYTTPRHNHNPIEPHAVTVTWREGELYLHDATQCVSHTAWSLGQAFGLKETQVHVTSPFVGGGFGSKTIWQHHVLASAASQLAGCPVRLALSREGVYRVVGGRTTTEQRVALGAQADGRFDAIVHTGVVPMTANNNMPEPFILGTLCMYASESFKLGVESARMDMLANTFMRAPGESVGTFALESAVDELADQMGMDPIELRIRNEPDQDPTQGIPFSSRNLVECYRTGAEKFGWDKRNAKPGTRLEGEWLVGLGMAAATYPYQRMPGGAARITLTRGGSATVEIAAHEMGMGTATTTAVVAAERLGLPLERVTVGYGDSALPGTVLAGGSQQTASIGAAVLAAHQELVAALLKLAPKGSPLADAKPDEVACRDGGLYKLDEPEVHESYAVLLGRAGKDELAVEGMAPPPLEAMHWSMHSFGAVFCEARVNAITGETRISRVLGVYDCGRILNAKTAKSQFRGGIIMGLGLALMEETQFDERNGRVMNPSMAEYHLPVHMDVPEIDVMWTDIPDPHAPMGAHGIGEIGITGVGAAVANAVFNATGKRVRELPITLDKLM